MFSRIVVRIRKGMKYFTDIQQSWDVGSVCWLCCGERHNLGGFVLFDGAEKLDLIERFHVNYERLPEWETHLFFSTFLKGNFSFFRATFSRFLSASNWNDSSNIQKPLTRFLLSHMADIIRKRAAGFSRQTCQKLHIVFLVKKNLHTLYVFWCITIQATGRGKKRWRCNKQSTGRKRKVFK